MGAWHRPELGSRGPCAGRVRISRPERATTGGGPERLRDAMRSQARQACLDASPWLPRRDPVVCPGSPDVVSLRKRAGAGAAASRPALLCVSRWESRFVIRSRPRHVIGHRTPSTRAGDDPTIPQEHETKHTRSLTNRCLPRSAMRKDDRRLLAASTRHPAGRPGSAWWSWGWASSPVEHHGASTLNPASAMHACPSAFPLLDI